MTVCKTYNGKPLENNKLYKKDQLFDNMQKIEKRFSTYYDPERKVLFSFFNSYNTKWTNRYDEDSNTLSFNLTSGANTDSQPAWEIQIKRHVFYRKKNDKAGYYQYLGIAISETSKKTKTGVIRIFKMFKT